MGAEKALFRALKAKKNTPKYGLIYNASIVGSAKNQIKGKISRTLANKCALCVRFDALAEDTDGGLGVKNKAFMEGRLKLLESGGNVIKPFTKKEGGMKKWEAKAESKGYNNTEDFVEPEEPKKKRKRS